MSTKAEDVAYRLDGLKWVVVVAILGAGIYANAYFGAEPVIYRAIAGIVIAAIAIAVALQTAAGAATWELARESRTEIRKVVWPSRQETTQTTLIVVAVVFVVAIILWLLDTGVSWLVKDLIG